MNDQNPQWIRKPLAPPPHIAYAHKLGRGMLTFQQIDELVKAINPAYVETKQKLTYLAQHQARAEMNRIFGYGNWDVDADEPQLMYEERITDTNDPRWPREYKSTAPKKSASGAYWITAYRIRVTVRIRDFWGMPVAEYTGVHAEENAIQPNRGEAHALALTSVDSYALRRALINLGDRFGLGLYNGGSKAQHGIYTSQLEPGNLFEWAPAGQQPAAAPAPTQPTHETIPAEPAVPEYRGEEEPQQQQQQQQQQPSGLPQSPQMQQFHQVQQCMQRQRENERQQMNPDMQARLQQGLKTDGQQG